MCLCVTLSLAARVDMLRQSVICKDPLTLHPQRVNQTSIYYELRVHKCIRVASRGVAINMKKKTSLAWRWFNFCWYRTRGVRVKVQIGRFKLVQCQIILHEKRRDVNKHIVLTVRSGNQKQKFKW